MKIILKIIYILKLWFPLVMTVLAGWFLWHELRDLHVRQILESVHALGLYSIVVALTITAVNYALLSGYDYLAIRSTGYSIKYRKVVFASFLSYAFSYNFGFLFGSALRSRIYSSLGLSTVEITRAVSFLFLTFWLGFCAITGIVFALVAQSLPGVLSALPFATTRPIGLSLIVLVAIFLIWISYKSRKIIIADFTWQFPKSSLAIQQIILASTDWLLAAGVLYVLLQQAVSISYWHLLSIFLLAQFVAVVSHVPGGIGVFETSFLVLLPAGADTAAVVSSLLAYRAIYYVVPLLVAIVSFGVKQAIEKRRILRLGTERAKNILESSVPIALSLAIYLGGIVLLVSGALPAEHSRLELLRTFVPLPAIELSHFLASILGLFLLFLAGLIRRRVILAYYITSGLLVAGIIFSLVKGFDYEEAIILIVILLILLPARKVFNRRDALLTVRFTYSWLLSIFLVVISTIWLGMFAHKHVEYSNQLWWTFVLQGDASRFLRASVGVIVGTLIIAGIKLFRSRHVMPSLPTKDDLVLISQLAVQSKQTVAYLGLLGDKFILFNSKKDGFVMYGIEGKSAIALGDPVAKTETARRQLAWDFRSYCDDQGLRTVFYQVAPSNLPLYLDMGLTLLKLGEEAITNVQTFSLEGSHKKSLRYISKHLEEDGYLYRFIPAAQTIKFLPNLKKISDAWLETKNTKEKGFSLGVFKQDYLAYFPLAVIQNNEGDIVAFANLFLGSQEKEFAVDLMRYDPSKAPNDVMSYLFIKLIEWGRREGYQGFSLGMAPLSGISQDDLAPFWNKVSNVIFHHSEHFYNFKGLRAYKNKFDPVWEPRYLATPGALSSVGALKDVAAIISGGVKGIVRK